MAEKKTENPPEATEPRTRAEILSALDDFDGAIKALQDDGGDDLNSLNDEQLSDLEAFIEARDELRGRLANLPDPGALKARMDDYDAAKTTVKRPRLGGQSSPGTGSEVKTTIEATESEYEKFIEKGPFKSLAHFAHDIRANGAAIKSGLPGLESVNAWRDGVLKADNAVKAIFGDTKATGLNEFSDSEGGILVPPTMANGLWKRSIDDDFNFLALCDNIPVQGNAVKVRAVNDKSRADGSRNGGVSAYWTAEAGQFSGSKPTYRTIDLRLNKLTVLVYATEELLEDGLGVEAEINRVASEEIRFKVNDALFRGSGAGMPLGVLNAGCKVTVTSNNGASATISAIDIDNMWKRRARASGQGYIWLANQDTEGELSALKYVSGSTPYAAVWRHVPGEPMQYTIKGKPLYYTEFNETLGTEGDLILVDPKQIAAAVKSTGVKSAVSMHLRFDYEETAFRFSFRMDARPYWETSLTRFKGSDALSPIITLETTRSS